jgi:hypothetical protein
MQPNFTPAPTRLSRQNWCGPFALSIMAGQDYDTVYPRALRSLRAYTKRRYAKSFQVKLPTRIQGLYDFELKAIAKTLGYQIEWSTPPKNERGIAPNLKQAIDHLLPRRFYVVQITRHFITIDTYTWQWCDNHSKVWAPIDTCKWLRTRVDSFAEYQPKWRSK